jgi:acyl carrier protein
MDTESIEKEIIHFLESNILSEGIKIYPDSSLRDVGIDSFSIVEIILFIERKYNVIIPDHKLIPDNFKTIRTIAITVKELGI